VAGLVRLFPFVARNIMLNGFIPCPGFPSGLKWSFMNKPDDGR
jgi:hypothetical protein